MEPSSGKTSIGQATQKEGLFALGMLLVAIGLLIPLVPDIICKLSGLEWGSPQRKIAFVIRCIVFCAGLLLVALQVRGLTLRLVLLGAVALSILLILI